MKIKSFIFLSSLSLLTAYAPLAFSAGAPGDEAVVGTPAPGSKFAKIQVGMYSKEVMDLIGAPNDQKTYMTGKAWIPFHFGSDNSRTEFHYKGEGTLTFANGGVGNLGSMKLIKITVDTAESGYIH
ncbi:hypothetical protein [Dyella agri]|uniref:SmpA / OmlA family protein n=1 Tax=Dyella agri TaxID=1926869 RepID=A0ABW8KDC5_9GAMM